MPAAARAERLLAHARMRRAEATRRVERSSQAFDRVSRTLAATRTWLGSARAERPARGSNPADEAGSLIDGVQADGERPKKLLLFDPDFCLVQDRTSVANALLAAAIALSRADQGNVQLCDRSGRRLRIEAHHGFDEEFLSYFEVVEGQESACGVALARRQTVQVADVARSHVFDGGSTRDVVLGAGVRAVRSIPLIDSRLGLLGVLSVHYRYAGRPDAAEQNILSTLAATGTRRLAQRS